MEHYKELLLPLYNQINELRLKGVKQINIGIDGISASGKSTIAMYLQNELDCNLFHMDDFFLQPHQRTVERLNEIGGNVDYERFKLEVVEPLLEGRSICYRPYSCRIGRIKEEYNIEPKLINIIEGAYCQHPYFNKVYHIKVFVFTKEQTQLERILHRNGSDMLERFIKEWIPKEQAYIKKFGIMEKSLVIEN